MSGGVKEYVFYSLLGSALACSTRLLMAKLESEQHSMTRKSNRKQPITQDQS